MAAKRSVNNLRLMTAAPGLITGHKCRLAQIIDTSISAAGLGVWRSLTVEHRASLHRPEAWFFSLNDGSRQCHFPSKLLTTEHLT
ncbi:hypothetical protein J6590_011587 [Homalodisca vitripennis]|nr:hypothetical protein J6590_011587 [Homalodisca vitripennis]